MPIFYLLITKRFEETKFTNYLTPKTSIICNLLNINQNVIDYEIVKYL